MSNEDARVAKVRPALPFPVPVVPLLKSDYAPLA